MNKGKEKQIDQVLARTVRTDLERAHFLDEGLMEIHLRIGKPLLVVHKNEEQMVRTHAGVLHLVTADEVYETLDYVCHYSLYAYENDMRQGFVTIEGGHRVGVAGQVLMENGKIKNISYVSSLNIRIAHEVIGCADSILSYVVDQRHIYNTLIVSPPGCGKTTLLRDLIRQISNGSQNRRGYTVGVVDERSELGGSVKGIAQNDLGIRTDVLDHCPKKEGLLMLIRSMAPNVLAVDEIGGIEEVPAIEYAMQSGCRLIASIHGNDLQDVSQKAGMKRLSERRLFDRYILLDPHQKPGTVRAIVDAEGKWVCTEY